ncbi:bifunctional diguanylate cyclase/phosphodiesterase [Rhodobacteraceae bacterium]|nr:bifunctional diguanylate cyclase/phosphodiesterase [Paracoccaceae bacterium]
MTGKMPTGYMLLKLGRIIKRPYVLACLPVSSLLAYWAFGEIALIIIAILLPLALIALGQMGSSAVWLNSETDELTGSLLRDGLIAWVDNAAPQAAKADREIAVISLVIDDLDNLENRFGRAMRDTVVEETANRIRGFLREEDVIARINPGFAIGLKNVRAPETEILLQLARRLQSIFDEPFCEGPTRTYCSMSLGLASECHVKGKGGANLVAGAQRACELAAVSGPGSVRVYSEGLSGIRASDVDTARELSGALETGEIFAWFQPQLKTGTNVVTGFEALARWHHPERGVIAPGAFLEDIEKAGLSQRLAEVILKQSLTALTAWDAAGFDVPSISVNFSSEELRNPRLPDYVRWELDRHNIDPQRLVVEVLESVVAATSEDIISRTLNALSQIGCRIDLDDFGTGYTSFINIRRFNVGRIKIDRSLVSHLDRDDAQNRMVSALLAFSRELKIDALAEGVETKEEVEALKLLNCQEIQGYVAARPMPLGETLLWLEEVAPPTSTRPKLRSVK